MAAMTVRRLVSLPAVIAVFTVLLPPSFQPDVVIPFVLPGCCDSPYPSVFRSTFSFGASSKLESTAGCHCLNEGRCTRLPLPATTASGQAACGATSFLQPHVSFPLDCATLKFGRGQLQSGPRPWRFPMSASFVGGAVLQTYDPPTDITPGSGSEPEPSFDALSIPHHASYHAPYRRVVDEPVPFDRLPKTFTLDISPGLADPGSCGHTHLSTPAPTPTPTPTPTPYPHAGGVPPVGAGSSSMLLRLQAIPCQAMRDLLEVRPDSEARLGRAEHPAGPSNEPTHPSSSRLTNPASVRVVYSPWEDLDEASLLALLALARQVSTLCGVAPDASIGSEHQQRIPSPGKSHPSRDPGEWLYLSHPEVVGLLYLIAVGEGSEGKPTEECAPVGGEEDISGSPNLDPHQSHGRIPNTEGRPTIAEVRAVAGHPASARRQLFNNINHVAAHRLSVLRRMRQTIKQASFTFGSAKHLRLSYARFGDLAGVPAVSLVHEIAVSWSLHEYGEWESSQTKLLQCLLSPGDVALDIGAHIGTQTVAMAGAVFPGGVVHAFEPQRGVVEVLRVNADMAGFGNIVVHHNAVGEKTPEPASVPIAILDFFGTPREGSAGSKPASRWNYGAFSLKPHRNAEVFPGLASAPNAGAGFETVKVVAIDDFGWFNGTSCPKLIKVDVEHLELEVLRGARRTINACTPFLHIESDLRGDKTTTEVMEFVMQGLGYDCYWDAMRFQDVDNFFGTSLATAQDASKHRVQVHVSPNLLCVHLRRHPLGFNDPSLPRTIRWLAQELTRVTLSNTVGNPAAPEGCLGSDGPSRSCPLPISRVRRDVVVPDWLPPGIQFAVFNSDSASEESRIRSVPLSEFNMLSF